MDRSGGAVVVVVVVARERSKSAPTAAEPTARRSRRDTTTVDGAGADGMARHRRDEESTHSCSSSSCGGPRPQFMIRTAFSSTSTTSPGDDRIAVVRCLSSCIGLRIKGMGVLLLVLVVTSRCRGQTVYY